MLLLADPSKHKDSLTRHQASVSRQRTDHLSSGATKFSNTFALRWLHLRAAAYFPLKNCFVGKYSCLHCHKGVIYDAFIEYSMPYLLFDSNFNFFVVLRVSFNESMIYMYIFCQYHPNNILNKKMTNFLHTYKH